MFRDVYRAKQFLVVKTLQWRKQIHFIKDIILIMIILNQLPSGGHLTGMRLICFDGSEVLFFPRLTAFKVDPVHEAAFNIVVDSSVDGRTVQRN